MYPLVLLLGVATYRQDERSFAYTLPLSIAGLVVAAYHVLYENVPAVRGMGVCAGGVPCEVKYIEWLGFITIPVLSLTAVTIKIGRAHVCTPVTCKSRMPSAA